MPNIITELANQPDLIDSEGIEIRVIGRQKTVLLN